MNCQKGYIMSADGVCQPRGGYTTSAKYHGIVNKNNMGTGPVGAFAEYCMEAQQNYMQCATAGGPGPCMGSGAGDCNCQTQIIQNDFLPGIVGSWQWEGSGVGSSAFEWGNVATEICMCTPGPTLMNELQTACRRMGGSGVPTPGGGGGTGNWGGQGSGRFSKGGRIRRRRRRR